MKRVSNISGVLGILLVLEGILLPGLGNVQTAFAATSILYVDADAGGSRSGASWADAYNDLQSALSTASAGSEIWVAAGSYYPGDSREDSFAMKNGVGIYGGFDPATGDTAWSQRDWERNATILSGDIGAPGNPTDNSYHVFYHAEGVGLDGTAVLDGFSITGGNADGSSGTSDGGSGGGMYNHYSSPTLRHLTFSANQAVEQGGGLYNDHASPSLSGCAFVGNSSYGDGGGMSNWWSSPIVRGSIFSDNSAADDGGGSANWWSAPGLVNCVFAGNTASGRGGGVFNYGLGSDAGVTNCTFYSNSALGGGGGLNNSYGQPELVNCILWGNTPEQISGPSVSASYSDIQDGYLGAGNIDSDPQLTDPAGGQFTLSPLSPCIDAGDSAAPYLPPWDFEGEERIAGGAVDIGADELTGELPRVTGKVFLGGDPVVGCKVTLRQSGEPDQHTQTGVDGRYEFLTMVPDKTATVMLTGRAQQAGGPNSPDDGEAAAREPLTITMPTDPLALHGRDTVTASIPSSPLILEEQAPLTATVPSVPVALEQSKPVTASVPAGPIMQDGQDPAAASIPAAPLSLEEQTPLTATVPGTPVVLEQREPVTASVPVGSIMHDGQDTATASNPSAPLILEEQPPVTATVPSVPVVLEQSKPVTASVPAGPIMQDGENSAANTVRGDLTGKDSQNPATAPGGPADPAVQVSPSPVAETMPGEPPVPNDGNLVTAVVTAVPLAPRGSPDGTATATGGPAGPEGHSRGTAAPGATPTPLKGGGGTDAGVSETTTLTGSIEFHGLPLADRTVVLRQPQEPSQQTQTDDGGDFGFSDAQGQKPFRATIDGCLEAGCNEFQAVTDAIEHSESVMWIGAHVDDELYLGGMLGHLARDLGFDCTLVSVLDLHHPNMEGATEQSAIFLNASVYHIAEITGNEPPDCDYDISCMVETWRLDGTKEVMISILQEVQPQVVFTFEPSSNHRVQPVHAATAILAKEALCESGVSSNRFYAFQSASLTRDEAEPEAWGVTDVFDLNDSLWSYRLTLFSIYSPWADPLQTIIDDSASQDNLLHQELFRRPLGDCCDGS